MTNNIKLFFLLVIALFNMESYGQEPEREIKTVTINFMEDTAAVLLNLGNVVIKPTVKAIKVNLKENDLEIGVVKYKSAHLVKIYADDALECEGMDTLTDPFTKMTKITISKGKLNLRRDYAVGSRFKIVLPQQNRSLVILTGLDTLKKCPEFTTAVLEGRRDDAKKEDRLNIGIAYHDALFLAHDKDSAKKKEVLQYYAGLTGPVDCNQIRESLKSNPFLSGIINQICRDTASLDSTAKLQSTKAPGGLSFSAIGGLDVTNIADGLARFLIKRGKEELNIAFFQNLKEFLESHIESKTLFPSTVQFLDGIGSWRYAEFLPSLREAFYKDISSLVVNLNHLIDLPKYQALLKSLPEIRIAVRSAKIISELTQPDSSLHPADLIHHFAEINEWGELNKNLANSWKVLDRISESVRQYEKFEEKKSMSIVARTDTILSVPKKITEDLTIMEPVTIRKGQTFTITKSEVKTKLSKEIAWIKFSDFSKNLLKDSNVLKIYLGLLYEKMQGITFRNKSGRVKTVQQFMLENKDNIFVISDLVENFLVLANSVESSIKDIKQLNGNALSNEAYYTYINKAIDVVEYGFKVANTIHAVTSGNKEPVISDDRYIVMAKNANNLYKNIYTKDYNAAIMNAYLILDEVLVKTNKAIEEKQNYFVASKPFDSTHLYNFKTDSLTFTKSLVAIEENKLLQEDSIINRSEIVQDILKYGNAIASIVKAESSEEAAAAIEAAALPAGSSSIKKNSKFNISLNSFIGGSYSNYTNSTDKIDGSNSNLSVTAPLGIAASFGLGHYLNKKGKETSIGSLSLYLTVIDVGAIAGYRLTNDSTELEQKVTIDDIFTPGGYIVYGLGGLPFLQYIPLSFGYGWQYGSKLYYKTSTGTLATSNKSRWRSNFFVGIDIPLANFWTRPVRKKQ